mmetsp:Transcript_3465/g.10725  ORF Transcript_3465/g.10725 Transcript_3465/m.10725 type:complete len:2145 (+) Transcript_3465:96-6530(+)
MKVRLSVWFLRGAGCVVALMVAVNCLRDSYTMPTSPESVCSQDRGGFCGVPDELVTWSESLPDVPGWKDLTDAESRALIPRTGGPGNVDHANVMAHVAPPLAAAHYAKIEAEALGASAHSVAVLAVVARVRTEAKEAGGRLVDCIPRLHAEINVWRRDKVAHPVVTAMLHAVLGRWLAAYYSRTRWYIASRSETSAAQPPGSIYGSGSDGSDFNITEWGEMQVVRAIHAQYYAALSGTALSNAMLVENYPLLQGFEHTMLHEGENRQLLFSLRPTLFDVVAHDAIRVFREHLMTAVPQAGHFEGDGSRGQNVALYALAPRLEFLQRGVPWVPATPKADVAILSLYQRLLTLHSKDPTRIEALVDADIARCLHGRNAETEDSEGDFQKRLQELAAEVAPHGAARARYLWARSLFDRGDLAPARAVALDFDIAAKDTIGKAQCRALVKMIEKPSVSVTVAKVWTSQRSVVLVRHKNIRRVHFRLVRLPHSGALECQEELPNPSTWVSEVLLSGQAAASWSAELPPTPDFREMVGNYTVPGKIATGRYGLVASMDPDFATATNEMSFAQLWVSDLAIVMRNDYNDGKIRGFVVDADTGHPLRSSAVTLSYCPLGRHNPKPSVSTVQTSSDDLGAFVVDKQANGRGHHLMAHIVAELDGRKVGIKDVRLDFWPRTRDTATRRISLLTDRSVYRPGQIIHTKGIVLYASPASDNYKTERLEVVTVTLTDPSGHIVDNVDLRCNVFGSFSASFSAPQNRLLGRYEIRASATGYYGTTSISIEMYKRPQFFVELQSPKRPPRLNSTVLVCGMVTDYAGLPMPSSEGTFRVVRNTAWPGWWWSYRGYFGHPRDRERAEIAKGNVSVDQDGKMCIKFTATPPPSTSDEGAPVFRFSVSVQITAPSGESHSAETTVSAGFMPLVAVLEVDKWQTSAHAVSITVSFTSLDRVIKSNVSAVIQVYNTSSSLTHTVRPWPFASHRSAEVQQDRRPVIDAVSFSTAPSGKSVVTLPHTLPAGQYLVELSARSNDMTRRAQAFAHLRIVDPLATQSAPGTKVSDLTVSTVTALPGETVLVVWATAIHNARGYIEIEHRHNTTRRLWTPLGCTQHVLQLAVNESHRGGFYVHSFQVVANRVFVETVRVNVPWRSHTLKLETTALDATLQPGTAANWTVRLLQLANVSSKTSVEVAAVMYDASLDAIKVHSWPQDFLFLYRQDQTAVSFVHSNAALPTRKIVHIPQSHIPHYHVDSALQPRLSKRLGATFGRGREGARSRGHNHMVWEDEVMDEAMPRMAMQMAMPVGASADGDAAESYAATSNEKMMEGSETEENDVSDELLGSGELSVRRNLNETAFFFPHLIPDNKTGLLTINFSVPESLTTWKLLLLAHDANTRSGALLTTTLTVLELMIRPNAPRFVREGDTLHFPLRVASRLHHSIDAIVSLHIFDGGNASKDLTDAWMTNTNGSRHVRVLPHGQNTTLFKISVPHSTALPFAIRYVATVRRAGAKTADGEEGFIPVLQDKILLTDSMALAINQRDEESIFHMNALLQSATSTVPVLHQSLVLQITANPLWYALLALPSLFDCPQDTTLGVSDALASYALVKFLVKSRHVSTSIIDELRKWGSESRDLPQSPLETDLDLTRILLDETPWFRAAKEETLSRYRIGKLFSVDNVDMMYDTLLPTLQRRQNGDGGIPWLPGGDSNPFVTLYVLSSWVRLSKLSTLAVSRRETQNVLQRAVSFIDGWFVQRFTSLRDSCSADTTESPCGYGWGPNILLVQYLYVRSAETVTSIVPLPPYNVTHLGEPEMLFSKSAFDYFLGRVRQGWSTFRSRHMLALVAVTFHQLGSTDRADRALALLLDGSVNDPELGLHWKDEYDDARRWHSAPIEAHATAIEALHSIKGANSDLVRASCVWLLKQKQTQSWHSSQNTALAVFALLLGMGSGSTVQPTKMTVQVGNEVVRPRTAESGTGFFERRWLGANVTATLGTVRIKRSGTGVSWGGLHWQRLGSVAAGSISHNGPLSVTKELLGREAGGTTFAPLTEVLVRPGVEILVRLMLRSDRYIEFVHLRDQHASGFDTVNQASGYKYSGGTSYYQATKDSSTHFYFDMLAEGTHIVEYKLKVVHAGTYVAGFAEVESLYAKEFRSRSESFRINAAQL